MTTTQIDQAIIDAIITKRMLPEDSGEIVRDILTTLDPETAREELDVFSANCYRNDPNHSRYDADRTFYPRVEEGEFERQQAVLAAMRWDT